MAAACGITRRQGREKPDGRLGSKGRECAWPTSAVFRESLLTSLNHNQTKLSSPQVPASRPLPAFLEYIVMEC